MLFWLFIILIFLGFTLMLFAFWIEAKHRKKQSNSASSIFFDEVGEIIYYIGIWTAGISGVIAALMLILLFANKSALTERKLLMNKYIMVLYTRLKQRLSVMNLDLLIKSM